MFTQAEIQKPTFLLFGPQGVGKSTLSKILGKKLNMPVIESDAFINGGNWFSCEIWSEGWKIKKKNELVGMKNYLKNNLGKPVILDVGGSHGVWDDTKMLDEIITLIKDYPNRFLIIPSENEMENKELLRDRLLKRALKYFTSNIAYIEAILNNKDFAKYYNEKNKTEFIKKIELNRTTYNALNNVEWLEYDNSITTKLIIKPNMLHDYTNFFINTMKKSKIANHIIYNKGKSIEAVIAEIINKKM